MRNDNKIDIAVIVPVYNAKKYLKSCVNSILKSTLKNVKIILVDDGSVDGSAKICDQLAEKDSRVTVIHQDNQGSVKARMNGVMSQEAQQAEYLCFCDADDKFHPQFLEKMYDEAKNQNCDCVCADSKSMWKGIKIPKSYKAPCFQSKKVTYFVQEEIISNLYISCFGISDFPVSLWGKLYKRELLTEAIQFEPIVRFMGDDLSVMLRLIPQIQKLAIVPEELYYYRKGGGTSKFMPYMLEDFLNLYRFKTELRQQWKMPQDAHYLMDIELINIVRSWLLMCLEKGNYSELQMEQEIERLYKIDEIINAAHHVVQSKKNVHQLSNWIEDRDTEQILKSISESYKKNKWKTVIKNILLSI